MKIGNKLKQHNGSHKTRSQNGAIMAEFVLVFPVVLFILFSFIDFARVYFYIGSVTKVAHEVASDGQLIRGLENIPIDPGTGKPADPNHPLLKEIEGRAYRIINNRLNIPKIPYDVKPSGQYVYVKEPSPKQLPMFRLPIVTSGDLESTLRKEPLEVELNLVVRPLSPWLLPFNNTFNIKAAGYRELPPDPNNPSAIDCHGNVLEPGQALPNDCPCPGEEDSPVTRINGNCICIPTGQIVKPGDDCKCPEPKYYDPTTRTCKCPPCVGGQLTQNPNDCSCGCPPCSTFNPATGKCEETASCRVDQYRSGYCCKKCPGLKTNPNGGTVCDTCPFKPTQAHEACPSSSQIFNSSACRCEGCLPAGTTGDFTKPGDDGLSCICPSKEIFSNIDSYCKPNEVFYPGSAKAGNCRCQACPGGQIRITEDNSRLGYTCGCPDPTAEDRCKKRGSEYYWNPTSCQCQYCDPARKTWIKGKCVCDKNKRKACSNYKNHRWTPGGNCCTPCKGYAYVNDDLSACICDINPKKLAQRCLNQGQDYSTSSNVCGCVPCPNPNQIFDGRSCVCPKNCAAGQIQNEKDCSCDDLQCPVNFDIVDDQCTCTIDCANRPGGGTVDSNLCVCKCPGQWLDNSDNFCKPIDCRNANCIWNPDTGRWELPSE